MALISKEILAIIPARGGSKGVKNKNILNLCNQPVIYYTIKFAKECKLLNRIIVTTDSDKIAQIAKNYNVEVIKRPKELARDNTPMEPVLKHTINYLERKENYTPSIIVLLCANVPIRKKGIIEKCIDKLIKTDCSAVITVTEVGKYHPNWMIKLNNDRLNLFMPNNISIRQALPKLYLHDGAVVVVKKDILMKEPKSDLLYSFLGDDIRVVIQDRFDTVEIDDIFDVELAEYILKRRKLNCYNF